MCHVSVNQEKRNLLLPVDSFASGKENEMVCGNCLLMFGHFNSHCQPVHLIM